MTITSDGEIATLKRRWQPLGNPLCVFNHQIQVKEFWTMKVQRNLWLLLLASVAVGIVASTPAAAQKKPNVVMLMTDDTGWNDFGAYTGGGAALGHPTPNIDQIAKEGAVFTSWYGQASCTAGRASFMTGRIPIRSALSIVVVSPWKS
jgi:hypothetical protein